jgi:hypothetical protein
LYSNSNVLVLFLINPTLWYGHDLHKNDNSSLNPYCFMSLYVIIVWIATLLWNKMKESASLNSQLCISCRLDYSRRRWLRAYPRSSHRSFWRSRRHRRRSNWSSEPKFGKPWPYCPQLYARRQAPDINSILFTLHLCYLYLSLHYVLRNYLEP